MRSRRVSLEVLLIAVPVAIATFQMAASKSSDLTSWRGGGFGMYSDPHPNQSRNLWITGEREGEPAAVRVFPLDERLGYGAMRSSPFRLALRELRYTARLSRNFPSATNGAALARVVEKILAEHGDEAIVAELFPREGLGLTVMEASISRDFREFRVEPLLERPLWTP